MFKSVPALQLSSNSNGDRRHSLLWFMVINAQSMQHKQDPSTTVLLLSIYDSAWLVVLAVHYDCARLHVGSLL